MPKTLRRPQWLADIEAGELDEVGSGVSFEAYKAIVGMPAWSAIEDKYR